MKLKTLELQGFKSFPDKTVISFDKGITVIVGPNGSGKSNISDAMRWVLGEMSTKSIRGQKMEDVIFAGSQKRSPMGYAEVTVTFDNSGDDGERLESMAEYDEISVSRRYYRAGESEYFINRKKVRLRDVHELFMNTGLGKGGYSIIGQGKIAEIISQKNEERRAVFEEAAGISKYRYQKADAMRKLEQTNTNLSGAEIVLSELEGRVEPLRKEAEKAKKYLEIYEAKKALDISLSLFDIDEAKKKVDDIETKTAGAKAELDSIDETTAALETKYNSTYEALMRSKADSEQNIILSGDADAKAKAAEAEIRIAKTSNEHYAEMSSAAKQKFDDESKLYKEAEAEYNGTKKELDAAENEKRKISDKIAECDAEEAEKNSDAQGIDSQIREIGELIEAAKATEIETKVAISVAVAQKSSSANKSDELEAEIKKHGDDIAMFESRIKKAEEKIADYDKKADDIKTKLDGIDARKAEIADKQAKLGERKNTLFLDISQRRHRVQNLVRMDELLDGYSSAVRFVMNENSTGKISGAKICGPVSKLIEVDPKYATALEVAFGAMLQNIIVEDEDSAKTVIAYLKKKNAGRVTLYPISTMRGRELDAKAENIALCRGYVSVASALVKTDAKYAEIIKSLIGRVIVCDNIDNAADMARASGHKYKIVTLDGQVINAGGSFTGGSVSADGGMLSRRSQIEKLNAEIAELEKQSAEAEKEEAALANEAETIRKEEGVILGSASVLKTLRDAEVTQIEVIKSNIAVVKEAMDKLCDEKTLMLARVSKETDSIEELTKKENDCREKQVDLAQRIKELEDEKSSYGDGLDEIRARRAELEIELAKKDQFVSLKSEQAAGARARLEAQRENMERGRAESEEFADKIKLNEQKIEEYQMAMEDAEKLCLELAAKKDEIIAESDRLEKKLVEIRNTQSDTAHRRELAFEEYTRLESSHGQLTEKHDALINFLWETYELTYTAASALGYEKMTKEARSEAASKQQKYKNVMRQLGNVNVGSIDEYSDVKGRYEYYSTQIEDLHKSRDDLEDIISKLDATMKEDFTRTVDEINSHFGKTFSELFGGGHAEIKITDMSNILESGIEINVAPPGKIIKSLSLLSGGEQAFVAVALYFAILKVNPAPFCIMDEIESALDEINVDKFADYVKKYSSKTQFVLITHRRGTMEAAERLYGVTMHEKGISDVLSIDVSEIASKIGSDVN